MSKLAISVRDMAALLAISEDGVRFDASLVPVLGPHVGQDVLLRLAGTGEYVGIGRLATIEDEGGGAVVRFETIRSFDRQAFYWPQGVDAPSIGVLDDAAFDSVLRSGNLIVQRQAEDVAVHFVGVDDQAETIETFAAIAQTVLRETNYRCAATGVPLDVETSMSPHVFVLRPKDAGGLAHVNNCLALSPAAFAAFEQGHLTARDDFSLLADLCRIDPELLESINPLGRLIVSDNPALRPAMENLAYHRRTVFGF